MVSLKVMATAPMTREDMKDRIGQVYSEITIEQLIKVCQAFQQRLQLCLQQKEKHFEHLN